MSCFQNFHSDARRNLFFDTERNGEKYKRLLHHHTIVTMIYDLYKENMPRTSERTIQRRPTASNVLPVTKIVGDIYGGTAATDV